MVKILASLLSRIGRTNILSIQLTFKDGSSDFESQYPDGVSDISQLESMVNAVGVRTITLHCSDGRLAVVEYE